tara:strand:- start:57 stop:1145 length:1089 start_codon:yes stop_codon:yes gene_type:complete
MFNKTEILDCTLRDGSYVNNFQFNKNDTKKILNVLEDAGLKFIEIGHGIGLGASRIQKFKARESDKTYCQVASKNIKKANWGVFCIPGIATLDDIKMANDYGVKFVRIGSNVENFKDQEKYINLCKKLNIFVASNFMKSYLVNPKKFVNYVKAVHEFGTDLVYLVDSSGSMFPNEIEEYFYYIKKFNNKIRLGFHGHDNLGMSCANAFHAYKLGFDLIDVSMQGLGRSSGNTPLETFLCLLERHGVKNKIDKLKIMSFSEKEIANIFTRKGLSSLDLISGMSFFHSSFMPEIEKVAKKYSVDPRLLIIEHCKKNKTNAKEEDLEIIAKKLFKQGKIGKWKKIYSHYYGTEQNETIKKSIQKK